MYSYSKIECFRECPRKYKYRYIDKLDEPKNKYLEFGTKFHEAIPEGKSDDPIIDLMIKELYKNEEFKKYVDRIEKFEDKVVFDYVNRDFISFLDATGEDFILEFKSSKDKWSEKKFKEELQSALYIEAKNILENKIKEFVYFIVTKPDKNGEIEVQFRKVNHSNEKMKIISDTVNEIEREIDFEKRGNRYCWFCSFYNNCRY